MRWHTIIAFSIVFTVSLGILAVLAIAFSRDCTCPGPVGKAWQFPSHRDPNIQTFYIPTRRFFFEDLSVLKTVEKRDIARCYIAHCTEEGALANGNYENYTTSRQKGCSNYDYQDVNIFTQLFMEPRIRTQGVFVEIGAMTGWGASNTLFFEHCLNWTGVLFDISEDNYAQMLKNRPNPRVHKVLGTTCATKGRVYVARSVAGCCGQISTDPKLHSDPLYNRITCQPMSDWLEQLGGIRRVDYLSVDTEGYEYEVLASIDWARTQICVISVEMLDEPVLYPKHEAIRSLLDSQGYIYVPALSVARDSMNRDEIWVNFQCMSSQ